MKDKPVWLTYLNNTIAFLIFSILKLFFNPHKKGENILFINTGQIGDLIISSVIFRNSQQINKKYGNVFVIIKDKYSSLMENYKGLKIISWNYNKYRFNIFYRISFLRKIKRLNIRTCYNLTAARGVTNDELSLLSGAKKIYALNSNYIYLKKLFGQKIDNYYSKILCENEINEYKRNKSVLDHLKIKNIETDTTFMINTEVQSKINKILEPIKNHNIIVISPFTDINIKNWDLELYYNLIDKLLNHFNNLAILLIGTKDKKETLDKLTLIENKRITNYAGAFNIIESAALVNNCDIFIGNDSGFTHIAKGLNIPFVALIGGGSFGYFFPYNVKENERYLYHEMDCFGCEWRCIHKEPYCLTEVTVDEVLKNINEMLNNAVQF